MSLGFFWHLLQQRLFSPLAWSWRGKTTLPLPMNVIPGQLSDSWVLIPRLPDNQKLAGCHQSNDVK